MQRPFYFSSINADSTRQQDSNQEESEEIAVVDKSIHPGKKGRVCFQGSVWPAKCDSNLIISSGDDVRVIGRRRITLIVEPLI